MFVSILPLFVAGSVLAPEGLIEVDERSPAVMMVMTPRGPASKTRTSEVLEQSVALFDKYTGLALASIEQAGVDPARLQACPRNIQLGCWVELVLEAYETRNGQETQYSSPAFLIVVSLLADAKRGDRLTTLLIDLKQAQAIDAELPRSSEGRNLRRENILFETAVDSVSGFTRLSDVGGLRRYISELLTKGFRARLERSAQWNPFVQTRITAARGVLFRLDGRLMGALPEQTTLIKGLRPGRRQIEFSQVDGSIVPVSKLLNLKRGQREPENIVVEIRRKVPKSIEISKKSMMWTGVGFSLVGAGLLGFSALANQSVQVIQPCVGNACNEPLPATFSRFCDYSESGSGACSGLSSTMVAPMGYSLFLGGLTMTGAGVWGDDSGHFRWWGPLAGLALGTLSYGLSSQLGGL